MSQLRYLPFVALLAVMCGQAHAGTAKTFDTTLLEVKSEDGAISVYGTGNGNVFSVDPAQTGLISDLLKYKDSGVPVHVTFEEKELDDETVSIVTGVKPLNKKEAAAYRDPLQGYSRKELRAIINQDEQTGIDPLRESDLFFPQSIGLDSTSVDGTANANGTYTPTAEEAAAMPPSYQEAIQSGYDPHVLSYAKVKSLFDGLTPLKHDSQCHQRAMVWAWNMYNRTNIEGQGLRSMKIMMFFTSKFQNTFKMKGFWGDKPYKWWYHTAPFVYGEDPQTGQVEEWVLDPEFVRAPRKTNDWTFLFMSENLSSVTTWRLSRDQAKCRSMTRYQDLKNQNSDWCMIRRYPMYYMQPNDVEAMDCNKDTDTRSGSWGNEKMITLNGKQVPKYPCFPRKLTSWNNEWVQGSLKNARTNATPR